MDQVPKSKLLYYIEVCGPYLLLMLLAALTVFVLTLLLLVFGRKPAAWAALILIVPTPLLIGFFGTISNWNAGWAVLALSDTQLKPSELNGLFAEILIPLWVGMLLSAPTYFVAVVGLLIRSFGKDERGSS
jgi:hypothetical protein